MKKTGLPSYIQRKRGVLYFVKRSGGKPVWARMEAQFPDGKEPPAAFWAERERLLNGPAQVPAGKTIKTLIRSYIASARYRDLAARTASDYDPLLDIIRDKLGSLEPRHIERHHVIKWQAQWAKKYTAHKANYLRRVLSILMEHAKDEGLLTKSDANPCAGVKSIKYEKQDREEWPEQLVEKYRETATDRSLWCFELCVGTGQRIGDVLKMRWSDIQDGGVHVVQGKTGAKLWVPLTARLSAVLPEIPRRSVFILTNYRATGPWSYRGASQAIRAVREEIGALDYDIHALRYYAACELLKAGCTDDDIASITGQSAAMVRHYTRNVRQRVRAIKAQGMRSEQNRNET